MARTAHDLGSDADVLSVHSARSPAHLVFADELAALTRRPGFARVGIVSDGAGRDELPYMQAVRAMLDVAGFEPDAPEPVALAPSSGGMPAGSGSARSMRA